LIIQSELKQKDNIIELISKSVNDLRLEKQELKEEKMSLNNLLSLNEEELKEKDLEISLLKKLESEFNIDSEQISDLLKNNCTVQSIEQPESELVGDNFIKIE
jgi:hypothetical protein